MKPMTPRSSLDALAVGLIRGLRNTGLVAAFLLAFQAWGPPIVGPPPMPEYDPDRLIPFTFLPDKNHDHRNHSGEHHDRNRA